MAQTMYEQAILDAQNLKRMAEESAKNEVIKAIAPQIKEMIEKEIFADLNDAQVVLKEGVKEETKSVEEDEDQKRTTSSR